jgi:hypothetical protein
MADPQENKTAADTAILNYLQAVKIDPTDYSLWYHIGYLSQKLHKLRFARLAYETGFYMSDQERALKLPTVRSNDAIQIISSGNFTVMQWKCLENLCQVLFDIGDYRLCSFYVDIVLSRHSNWEAGLQLKKFMDVGKEQLQNNDDLSTTIEMETDRIDANPIMIRLEKPDWTVLIKSLLNEHRRLVLQENSNNNTKKVGAGDKEEKTKDGIAFTSHAILIHVEKEGEQEDVDDQNNTGKENNNIFQPQMSENAIPSEPNNALEKPVNQEPALPVEPIIVLEKPTNEDAMEVDFLSEKREPKVDVEKFEGIDSSLIKEPKIVVEKSNVSNLPPTFTLEHSTAPISLPLIKEPIIVVEKSNTTEPAVEATIIESEPLTTTFSIDEQPSVSVPAISIDDNDNNKIEKLSSINNLLSQPNVPMPLLTLVPNPTSTPTEFTSEIINDIEMVEAINPLKRKRDDNDDDGTTESQKNITHENIKHADNSNDEEEDEEEEEEEDEAEEKRLSLR